MERYIVIVYFSEAMLFLGTVTETITHTTVLTTHIFVKSLNWQKGLNPHMINTFASQNRSFICT